MKYYALSLVLCMVFVSLVSAAYGIDANANLGVKKSNSSSNGSLEANIDVDTQVTGNVNGQAVNAAAQVRYENGTVIRGVKNITVGEIRSGSRVNLSNGRVFEIKIMPETASATAIARLNLTVCKSEEGCTIVIKEVGKGNETRLAYGVNAMKNGKAFLLFKKTVNVSVEVDAQTGNVVSVKKPWWVRI